MNSRTRRFLQTLTVAVLIAYTTLLAYQSLSRAVHNAEAGGNIVKLGNYLDEDRDTYDAGEATSEIPSVTATMRPPTTKLNDVFISVKTTKLYHRQRLPIILKTWFQLAKAQTWFFTDTNDPEFQKQTNGHMINTNCSSSHYRKALCCKMSVEFDTFLETDKKIIVALRSLMAVVPAQLEGLNEQTFGLNLMLLHASLPIISGRLQLIPEQL
ncbi:fng [Trypoxylus dichotomus]